MMRQSGIAILLILVACLVTTTTHANDAMRLQSLRMGIQDTQTTRIVADVTQAPHYRVFVLANPVRVVIDMPQLDWDKNQKQTGLGKGLIKAYRFGRFRPGMTRVVFDMHVPVRVSSLFHIPARSDGKTSGLHRLVLDLQQVDAATFRKTIKEKPRISPGGKALFEIPKKDQAFAKKRKKSKPLIIIDPGHGGVDPGALAGRKKRLKEKTITLRVAHMMRDILRAGGRYHVRLTRDSDRFISLRRRITLAREAGADIFLSLHADSHPQKNVRGFAVYTLAESSSDREAAALATRENQSDVIAGMDLSQESNEVRSILIDLTQRETMNLSVNLATSIIGQVGDQHHLLGHSHRFAGFTVLKAPDIPSILIELGYLSNEKDRKNLQSKTHLKKLCHAIMQGIDDYFSTQSHVMLWDSGQRPSS